MLSGFGSAGPEEPVYCPPGPPGARTKKRKCKILSSMEKSQKNHSLDVYVLGGMPSPAKGGFYRALELAVNFWVSKMKNRHETASQSPDFDETLPTFWRDFCPPPGAPRAPWGGKKQRKKSKNQIPKNSQKIL